MDICLCGDKILVAYQRGKCELFSLDVEKKTLTNIEVISTGQMVRSVKEIVPGTIITMDRLGNIGGYTLYSKRFIELGGMNIGDVCRRLIGGNGIMMACGVTGSITQIAYNEVQQELAEELKRFQKKCLLEIMERKLYKNEIMFKFDHISQNITLKNTILLNLFKIFQRLSIEVQNEIINEYEETLNMSEKKDIKDLISNLLRLINT